MLRALKAKQLERFDLLLIGVRPDYQDKGVTSLIMNDFVPYLKQYNVQILETTSMLETNNKILSFFDGYERKQHKRRRAYEKSI